MSLCKECQKEIELRFNALINRQLKEKGLCYQCALWTVNTQNIDNQNIARVEGVQYFIGPETKEPNQYRGHNGRPFEIQFNDGRCIFTTNLFHNGKIPENFRARLPDNAVFVACKK